MNFLITNAGLAAATLATGGPKITIDGFKLGNAYGYSPAPEDTSVNGAVVYTGTPLAVLPYNSDSVNVQLQLPASAGPFDFGEIAIYQGSVMFAKAVYTTLQSKLSDVTNGVGSVWTLNCLLKLASAPALFNITVTNIATIPEIQGSAVTGPDSINSTLNAAIGIDAVGTIDGSLIEPYPIVLTRASSTEWGFEGYTRVTSNFSLTSATGSPTTGGNSAQFTSAYYGVNTSPLIYLIQNINTGQYVPVNTIDPTTGNFVLYRSASWLTTGTSYSLYIKDSYAYLRGRSLATPLMNGTAASGSSILWSLSDHVHPTDTTRAPLASPALTGVPTVPTAALNTSTTQIASTAFVQNQLNNNALTLGINGTITLPGGLVLKWGQHTNVADVEVVTFAVPFPTACVNIVLSIIGNDHNSADNPQVSVISNTQFTLRAEVDERSIYWQAIGY